MKLKKSKTILTGLFFVLGVTGLTGSFFMKNGTHHIQAQTVEEKALSTPQPRSNVSEELSRASMNGSGLEEQIESLTKQSDWKLIATSKQPYGYSMQVLESPNGKIKVFSQRFESAQKATESFKKQKDPSSTSLGISAESKSDIGEEAFTRKSTSLDSEIHLSFRSGIYFITISGKKQDVLKFAKYVESAIGNKSEKQ